MTKDTLDSTFLESTLFDYISGTWGSLLLVGPDGALMDDGLGGGPLIDLGGGVMVDERSDKGSTRGVTGDDEHASVTC